MSQDAAAPLEHGRYRLVGVLGEGGMATVYRAWDARLQVWRAIKVLDAALTDRPNVRQRFENEARTMARLHHRNIVTVHDVGADGARVFMVMELVEGGSLVDWVEENGPMPPRMALDVLGEVLAALQVAHDNHVVHRDIKPHNILVDRSGTAKVSDFGIARVADTDHSLTKTGAMMGTWTYMAPEQRTSARRVDARADVYAAGATLYALLTAREPFDLYTTELHEELFAGMPEDLAAPIKRACRYRPEDRYESADAMREALRTLAGEYATLPPGTPPLSCGDPGSLSAPPPPLEPEATLAAADPTFDVSASFARNEGGGGLQVVTSPTEVPPEPPSPTMIPGGTLSEEPHADSRRPGPPTVEVPRTRWAWAPWVLVGGMAGLVVVLAMLLGGAGVALLGRPTGGPTEASGSEPAATTPVEGQADQTPAPTAPEPTAAPASSTPATPPASSLPAPEPASPTPAPEPASSTPAPQPAPAPAPAPVPAPTILVHPRAKAVMVPVGLNSLPYFSKVLVDGKEIGRTPWSGELDEGTHKVVLEGSKGGRAELSIHLVAGQRQVLCWDYASSAPCPR